MPTCDSKSKQSTLGSLSASELDHHASEAAKVKRTKEQAYFNSYDFDAIEVLPYDSDENCNRNGHHSLPGKRGSHNQHVSHISYHSKRPTRGCKLCSLMPSATGINTTLPTIGHGHRHNQNLSNSYNHSHSHSHSLNNRHNRHKYQHSQHQQQLQLNKKKKKRRTLSPNCETHIDIEPNGGTGSFKHPQVPADSKRTYLKRISEFFSSRLSDKPHRIESLTAHQEQLRKEVTSTLSSSVLMESNARSIGKSYDGSSISSGSNKCENVDNTNFLLPRPALKHQGINFGSPMPLSVISNPGGTSTNLKTNSIASHQLTKTSSNSSSSTKSHQSTVESSISATDPVAVVSGNLKKPSTLHGGQGASENSGFTASLSSCAASSTSVESSSIDEVNAVVIDIAGVGASPMTGAHVVGVSSSVPQSKLNPSVVSSIVSDLQENYGEKLISSSASSVSGVHTSNGCNRRSINSVGAGANTPSGSSIDTTRMTVGDVHKTCRGAGNRNTRERTSSQSHYSTDKSGSSGYYSSNVCSTYSVDDHIYCEPVIDNLEVHQSNTLNTRSSCPRKIMREDHSDDDEDDRHHHIRHHVHDHQREDQMVKRNLRILETSIENLDRHLKTYPKLNPQDRIAAFTESNQVTVPTDLFQIHTINAGNCELLKNRYNHLPTIMEGGTTDGQTSIQKSWPDDIADDSLLDIDLDSFLLVSEGKSKGSVVSGIDNPTFNKSEILDDEDMENNYKCAKYINSCPEDAYKLESEVGSTLDNFLQKYEDQMHFQNTRELLEDVRDKIRLLTASAEEDHNTALATNFNTNLPLELEIMIKALKTELEAYLERMSQHSELEIRQLCTGLVKNENIVKMKKAFERHQSNGSESEYDFTYEAIHDGGTIVTVQHTRQEIQKTSIRCTSDPNFKMKRKSLCEIFPALNAECYAATSGSGIGVTGDDDTHLTVGVDKGTNIASSGVPRTQLQKNLSFHKPILNKLTDETNGEGDKDSMLDWHRKKPSIWELYYGTNRMNQTLLGKRGVIVTGNQAILSYPSSRPESDFTLDLPRAEQLRIKMEKEKKFRRRCRYLTTFLSLVFFLLTVMVVSLVLTRGKRMFGSMI